jgi:hypothetical protein
VAVPPSANCGSQALYPAFGVDAWPSSSLKCVLSIAIASPAWIGSAAVKVSRPRPAGVWGLLVPSPV